ncbi:exodeoxyribonuclease VII large subunit [Salimicrobium jeotgali]|uniref:Exodeoxyribonuclease 7 large subunit n=1 Tax=Salimicrobium jeotgali TaxID=1230341 RepID=K2GB64_9BACI|nr:exodeoxyribonuclease VII large subunit [Salimicrobium jeotgali]AKG04333.1 exodeoxyribonuclease VII large subunit [Salimicrobium jeotgali]EKE32308.1 exodeoxyribonuclease VII large subunit [Salimicrobium jeotgali]MBM7695921.1 exodeoxyribonuclease VII large subunit [Salimicrobium jeotgali]
MEDRYLTVTALTRYIKQKISRDSHLKEVWLRGEISNFKHHSRGHMYFSVKDDSARIQTVMFAGNNRNLNFAPENGMSVLIRGEINVYEPMGQYQLYAKEMIPDGIGDLHIAFEQLKDRLMKEGIFSDENKQSVPLIPAHIGVITSPTGAAIRDIITTVERRFPVVKISVLPVPVQGKRAASSVSRAIAYANQNLECDLLIVGRGGGSIEDLWGFNEEEVARAVYHSHIPIISAVGHETDTTIIDFAADYRAPTPTGAAEIAVPDWKELNSQIINYTRRLQQALDVKVEHAKERLQSLKKSYAFKYPKQLTQQKEQDLDRMMDRFHAAAERLQREKTDSAKRLENRLHQISPDKRLEREQANVRQLDNRLNKQMQRIVEEKKYRWQSLVQQLSLVNPLEIMKRGYALPYNEQNELIKSVKNVSEDETIHLQINDGTIYGKIIGWEEKKDE